MCLQVTLNKYKKMRWVTCACVLVGGWPVRAEKQNIKIWAHNICVKSCKEVIVEVRGKWELLVHFHGVLVVNQYRKGWKVTYSLNTADTSFYWKRCEKNIFESSRRIALEQRQQKIVARVEKIESPIRLLYCWLHNQTDSKDKFKRHDKKVHGQKDRHFVPRQNTIWTTSLAIRQTQCKEKYVCKTDKGNNSFFKINKYRLKIEWLIGTGNKWSDNRPIIWTGDTIGELEQWQKEMEVMPLPIYMLIYCSSAVKSSDWFIVEI
jgi:hypothetical protein